MDRLTAVRRLKRETSAGSSRKEVLAREACGVNECGGDAHLPYERAGGVFFAPTLPVAPPEAVGGGEGLGLHDLRVIDVTGVVAQALSERHASGERLEGVPLHVEGVLEVLHEIQLRGDG